MSKQTRIGFVITMVALFAFPIEADAGGFGIFKRFRAKRATCCPTPKCEPSPPVTCEPCAPAMGAASELRAEVESVPTVAPCYFAVGTPGGTPTSCTSPGAAIAEAQARGTYYAFNLYPCTCLTLTQSGKIPEATSTPGQVDTTTSNPTWKVYVLAEHKRTGNLKLLRTQKADGSGNVEPFWSAADAADRGRGEPGGQWMSTGMFLITEREVN